MNAQTPMETECIKFDNVYGINKYKNVWLEKESWYFKFGRPNGERCRWSLFLRDHITAFHSLPIKSLILLCSAVRSLNKSPNAFYFVNTKMSCGVMTLTGSKCLGGHFFYSLCWTEVCQSENSGTEVMRNSCVLFAIPTVKWHPFYWNFNLRDQKKEQCDSKMKRSQISESFELRSEIFS